MHNIRSNTKSINETGAAFVFSPRENKPLYTEVDTTFRYNEARTFTKHHK
jgi:hypothetical protein